MFKIEHKSDFIRVMSFIKPRIRSYSVGVIGICSFHAGIGVVFSLLVKDLFNAAIKGEKSLLLRGIVLVVAFMAVMAALTPVLRYLHNASLKRTMADIRVKAFEHIEKLPVTYFESRHSGDVISRITNDINAIEQIYASQMYLLLRCLLIGVFSAILMIILDWRTALVLMALGVAAAFMNTGFIKPIRKISDKIQAGLGELTERLTDIFAGFGIIKMFPIEKVMLNRYKTANNNVRKLSMDRVRINSLVDSLNFIMVWLSYSGVIAVGAFMVLDKYMDFGTMLAIMNLFGGVIYMFVQLGSFVTQMQSSLAGAARLFEILDEPAEPLHYDVDNTSEANEAIIKMENVVFSYDNANKVLDGVNISVREGQVAALVGPSGGGKSTVIKLLLGYYPPSEGGISIAGKPFGHYTLGEIRSMIAYVPQDAYLFDGTVEENILFGRPGATKEEVIMAAKAANAHEFILQQPEGYDTVIGERGTRLSGGQKQRIAIARALLKDAPILLLDEATSALDSESEQLVQNALDILMKNRTVIVIAHRLSTIEHADSIYVIEKGKVAEQGRHDELIKIKGIYNKLYSLQFQQTELGEAG